MNEQNPTLRWAQSTVTILSIDEVEAEILRRIGIVNWRVYLNNLAVIGSYRILRFLLSTRNYPVDMSVSDIPKYDFYDLTIMAQTVGELYEEIDRESGNLETLGYTYLGRSQDEVQVTFALVSQYLTLRANYVIDNAIAT
jgi:hypothetical protein